LRTAIAGFWSVEPARIIVGAGSADILFRAVLCRSRPGAELVHAVPTFPLLTAVIASPRGCVSRPVRLRNFVHDMGAMAAQVGSATTVVVVCNPHNPTGTLLPRAAIADFIRGIPPRVLIVVDEAYMEFASDEQSVADLVSAHDNLLVLRTFSKAYGLAGMRVGYGIGAPGLIAELQRWCMPFAVNAPAAVAARHALTDRACLRRVVEDIRRWRRDFVSRLADLGLEVPPSEANFVYLPLGEPETSRLLDLCTSEGVDVAAVDQGGVRITVDAPEPISRVLECISALCPDHR
jgi:histidinol-phosphate aminotransferase